MSNMTLFGILLTLGFLLLWIFENKIQEVFPRIQPKLVSLNHYLTILVALLTLVSYFLTDPDPGSTISISGNNSIAVQKNEGEIIVIKDTPNALSQTQTQFSFFGGDQVQIDPNNSGQIIVGNNSQIIIGTSESLKLELRRVIFKQIPEDAKRTADVFNPMYQVTNFIGRDCEKARLQEFLDTTKTMDVMVITGAGGSGKTRLAQELCIYAQQEKNGMRVLSMSMPSLSS